MLPGEGRAAGAGGAGAEGRGFPRGCCPPAASTVRGPRLDQLSSAVGGGLAGVGWGGGGERELVVKCSKKNYNLSRE